MSGEEMERLRALNLVQRVMKECETHLGMSDKGLAEFMIELGRDKKVSACLRESYALCWDRRQKMRAHMGFMC